MDHSLYKNFANQELNWIAADSYSAYQSNLKLRYNDLKNNGWVNANISYKLNSHGFRCSDFNNDPAAVFLGCSHTFGVGLPLDNVWTQVVANSLNLSSYNLGLPGTSNDTAFRLAYYWLSKIKPKIVILCQVESSRFEVINSEELIRFNSYLSDVNQLTPADKKFYKKWASTESNSELNKQKNVLAITQICSNLGTKIKIVDSCFFLNSRVDLARDLSHAGPITNNNFANHVLATL